jgi:hypothetical protein
MNRTEYKILRNVIIILELIIIKDNRIKSAKLERRPISSNFYVNKLNI